MYILIVGNITENEILKGKSEKRLNFWEVMAVDEAKYNGALDLQCLWRTHTD